MIYTFIIFPGAALLFLGNYPEQREKQWIHILKWVAIFIVWELFFIVTGRIEYQYGWHIGWSLAFDFVMFPLLRLHKKNPLLTYLLSAIVAVAVLWWFDVPVHIPVEKRN